MKTTLREGLGIVLGKNNMKKSGLVKNYPLAALHLAKVSGSEEVQDFIRTLSAGYTMADHEAALGGIVNEALPEIETPVEEPVMAEEPEEEEVEEVVEEEKPKAKPKKKKEEAKDEDDEVIDYEKMTYHQLAALVRKEGLVDAAKATGLRGKASFVAALEAHDKGEEPPVAEPEEDEEELKSVDEIPELEADSYEEMTAKELFDLCKERDIKVKARQKKKVYIDLLEEYDAEQEEPGEDEDEWDIDVDDDDWDI